MTANVVPFRKSSGGGPRARASGRAEGQLLPAATQQQAEALREARRKLFECWAIRAESRAIKRRYEERQARVQALLERIVSDVERA